MRIFYAPKFQHAIRKLPLSLVEKITERTLLFEKDSFDIRLHTHKLHGKLKSKWSFSIDYRYRILFEFDSAKNVTFLDIGDHEIYR